MVNRLAMRYSWLKEQNRPKGYVYKFVIGIPKLNSTNRLLHLKMALKDERDQFHDMLFYNLPDTYNNLFLKTGVLFQWFQKFCTNTEYLIKSDDDTVIDLERLDEHYMKDLEKNQEMMIWGRLIRNGKVERDQTKRWSVPLEKYPNKTFPDYVNGATYIMNRQAVNAILSQTPSTFTMFLEDVLFTAEKEEHWAKNVGGADKMARAAPKRGPKPRETGPQTRNGLSVFPLLRTHVVCALSAPHTLPPPGHICIYCALNRANVQVRVERGGNLGNSGP
ncbi:unnamed protein product [Bursaphelenchus xylophilus]|uniref:Hexosyltransferase n=1 Tax=Bursaphelenchus xylophilus TaxID=6326 RepID=A0A1I7RHT7_BURXY|nr:unnamed protein product [Bursaphelenchus xylophilus]CAG9115396.1 unnamed protein product [Bursaphelenchus xylophilus]